jgi:hypothetical protein
MLYVEAVDRNLPATGFKVFLAGGSTGCPDWQATVVDELRDEPDNVVLLNPRRKNFPIQDPAASLEQIKWEHDMLRLADLILFWFPKETLCPITLYELGAWTMAGTKPIEIGMHPEYQRRQDVTIQTGLVNPYIAITYKLSDLVQTVRDRRPPRLSGKEL